MLKIIKDKREFENARISKIRDIIKYYINKVFKTIDMKYIKTKDTFNDVSLFETVLIETVNYCNNDCSFCPVGADSRTKPKKYISIDTINKIANELNELNFSGRISLYNNNEPLMDERLGDIIQIFSEKVSNASISILTNGILLRNEHFKLFDIGLNKLSINNYSNAPKFIKPVKSFLKDYANLSDEIKNKLDIDVIYRNKFKELSNRAGNNKNKPILDILYLDKPCFLPHKQFVILGDGTVSLCCNDLYGNYSLGNVEKDNIIDIWNGAKYKNVRKKLLEFNSRKSISLCSNCDYVGLKG